MNHHEAAATANYGVPILATNIVLHDTLYARPLTNQDHAEKESGRAPGASLFRLLLHTHVLPPTNMRKTNHDESLENMYTLPLWIPVLVKLFHYIHHEILQLPMLVESGLIQIHQSIPLTSTYNPGTKTNRTENYAL